MRVLFLLMTVGGNLAQWSVVPGLAVGGVTPDLPLMLTVFFALRGGPEAGCLAGFVTGFLQDMAGGGLVGVQALTKALAGFAMAFARAIGEYGSVVFISGNMPMRTEITPLLIITKLDQYDYAGATAIAVVMLVFSLVLLLPINLLQKWSGSRDEKSVLVPEEIGTQGIGI